MGRAQPPPKASWFLFPTPQFLQQGSSPDSSTSSLPIPQLTTTPHHTSVWFPSPPDPAATRLLWARCASSLSHCQIDPQPPPTPSAPVASRTVEAASMGQRFPYQFCSLLAVTPEARPLPSLSFHTCKLAVTTVLSLLPTLDSVLSVGCVRVCLCMIRDKEHKDSL